MWRGPGADRDLHLVALKDEAAIGAHRRLDMGGWQLRDAIASGILAVAVGWRVHGALLLLIRIKVLLDHRLQVEIGGVFMRL
ncbi:hypothetical protein C2W62_10985 [Candidatus Entotheonella serta]|nr:hypothetical protein C2W62_10985 [Candidatus Entotheonella serta]